MSKLNKRVIGVVSALALGLSVSAVQADEKTAQAPAAEKPAAQAAPVPPAPGAQVPGAKVPGPQKPAAAPDARAAFTGGADELLPPQAQPGECYARAFVPPKYETVEEKVLKSEASEELEVVPPQIETVEQTVTIKEPSFKLELVPAVYETIEEKVMVKPESKKIEVIPAKFETVEIKVLDQPAHTVWKPGRGPVEKVDNGTGEIMCLVDVPATYKIVQKRKLVTPATTKETIIPAEYEVVKKSVMKTPPTTNKVEIPGEYKTVKVAKIVKAPEVARHTIKEEFQTVAKTNKVAEGRMEWRSVLCETNTDQKSIAQIQAALKASGFDPGATGGKMTPKTVEALREFQKQKGLAVGGLTLETLDALGVKKSTEMEKAAS